MARRKKIQETFICDITGKEVDQLLPEHKIRIMIDGEWREFELCQQAHAAMVIILTSDASITNIIPEKPTLPKLTPEELAILAEDDDHDTNQKQEDNLFDIYTQEDNETSETDDYWETDESVEIVKVNSVDDIDTESMDALNNPIQAYNQIVQVARKTDIPEVDFAMESTNGTLKDEARPDISPGAHTYSTDVNSAGKKLLERRLDKDKRVEKECQSKVGKNFNIKPR